MPSSLMKLTFLLLLSLLTLTILPEASLIYCLLSFNIYFLKEPSQITLPPQNDLIRRG